jgi:hypothetical protein
MLLFSDTRELAKQMYCFNVLTNEQVRHVYNKEEFKVLSTEEGALKGFCPCILFRVTEVLKVSPS